MLNPNELISLLQGGVYAPQEAVGLWEGQEAERMERKRAQRAAEQDAFAELQSGIGSLASTESQQGTTLDELAQMASAKYGQTMSPESLYQLPGVSDVFLPTGQTGFEGNAGQSRLNPTLPPEIAAAIQSDIMSAAKTPDEVLAAMQGHFGPNTFSRLLPEITAVINKAGQGWSGQ